MKLDERAPIATAVCVVDLLSRRLQPAAQPAPPPRSEPDAGARSTSPSFAVAHQIPVVRAVRVLNRANATAPLSPSLRSRAAVAGSRTGPHSRTSFSSAARAYRAAGS